jgi:hypothetical protein
VENQQTIIDNGLSWNFSISAFASSSLRGSAYIKIKQGYSGPVRCRVTRKYYLNPPTNTPSIKNWEPVYGSLTINGVGRFTRVSSDVSGAGDLRYKQGNSRQIRTDTFANTIIFGPVVHSGVTLANENPPDTVVSENSDVFIGTLTPETTLPDGAPYPVVGAQVAASGKAVLELPASSEPPSSGSSNIGMVNVEKWRFGVWVEEVYEVYYP